MAKRGGWRIIEKLTSSEQRGFDGCGRWWSHSRGGRELELLHGCGMEHSCADGVIAGTSRLSRPGAGSDLSLSHLLSARGMRGGSHGVNVHHGDDAETPKTMKSPLLHASNIKVVL
jgi:hypothetical protein